MLATTADSPGLPLITSATTSEDDVKRLRLCLTEAMGSASEDHSGDEDLPGCRPHREHCRLRSARRTLRIKDIKVWTNQDEANDAYERISEMEREAYAAGYALLR